MRFSGVELDLGRFRIAIPVCFVLGVIGTSQLLVWSGRAQFVQDAPRTEGVVDQVGYYNSTRRGGACAIDLRLHDGELLVFSTSRRSCEDVRPQRFAGQPVTMLSFWSGGVAEVVIGGEVIEPFELRRRHYNFTIGLIVWLPFIISLIRLQGYVERQIKAAREGAKPGAE